MEIRKRNESDKKEFVDVIAAHYAADGRIEPLRLRRAGGTTIIVSKVFDARKAASLRAGGAGIRYECRVVNAEDGHEFRLYLFHDGDYWFIETNGNGSIVYAD